MKIRQIRFKNINSFYGEHDPIVFSDGILAQTGLFVIAGPTGAGKSTLLDVITLALFNRVPRVTEGDGRGMSREKMLAEGLIINQKAANEAKAEVYAEVEYELKGRAYRSRWSIEKNRNGNWNDYDMEVALLPDGQIISNKKRDVPDLNVQHIGLTYEQFIRSMVLAQGAFDKFLKATSGERSKLLEQITGTEIYRRLSQRAHLEHKDREDKLKWQRQEVGAVQLLPDEKIAELTQQQTGVKQRLDELDKELILLRAENELLRKVADEDNRLAEFKQQAAILAARQQAFTPKTMLLANHQRVADLAGDLADLVSIARSHDQAEKEKATADKALGEQRTGVAKLLTQAQTLTQQPTLGIGDLVEQVNLFRDQVLALNKQIFDEQATTDKPYQLIQSLVTSSNDAWIKALNLQDMPQVAVQLTDRRNSMAPQLLALTHEYPAVTPETIQTSIREATVREQVVGELIRLLREQQERLIEGMNLKQKVAEQQKISAVEAQILDGLDLGFTALEQEKEAIQQQKTQLDREVSVEKLRQGLLQGEPCPLCGSLHHPYAHEYVRQAGNIELKLKLATEDIEAKRRERDSSRKRLIEAQTVEKTAQEQVVEMRNLYKEKWLVITQKLSQSGFDTSHTPELLSDIRASITTQINELADLQQGWALDQRLQQLQAELTVLLESKTRLDQLKAQKDRLFRGDDVKQVGDQLLKQFYDVNQKIAAQQELWKKADADSRKFDQEHAILSNALGPLLHERGFSDSNAARACLLDAPTLHNLNDEQRKLDEQRHAIDVKTKQATEARDRAIDTRQTTFAADAVISQLAILGEEQRQESERIGHVKEQLKADTDQRRQYDKLVKKLEELERQTAPWIQLNDLIGSAKGDKFSRFAQGLTLTQLISLANQRLRDLSDRYLLLKPRDGQNELYVFDQYQGGAERTVTSLSGGETFTLSLALALALSDLASHNVQIDSLFVDEGFGTLDPETLDTAIDMLEKLQQQTHKTIGIISHRHEIKERISVQIQIDKGNDGTSRVKVVAL